MLTGYMSMSGERRDLSAEYNAFLTVIPEKEHERVKRTLRRLFPKLDGIWANIWHTSDQFARKFRRVCTFEHFNTYFRFAIGEDVLPATAITSFVEQAGDRDFVQNTLLNALKVSVQSGATRASIYLEQLRVHADRIEKEKVPDFIKALLEIGDDLDVEEDQGRGFYGSTSNNDTRLWRLVWTVLAERFDQAERSAIILSAIEAAQLHTLIGLAERCKSQHDRQSYDEPIVDKPTADKLIELSRERLRAAAKDGGLLIHRHLFRLLWAWTRTGNGALEEVKEAAKNSLGNDQFILHLASSAAGVSWSMSMGFGGMGDLVSKRGLNVQRDAISPLIDVPTFLARLKEIAEKDPKSADATFVGVFMDAWNNSEHGDLRGPAAATPAEDAPDADEAVSAEPLTEDDSSA
jgi:predicted KAP-like P-loop ATPase